MSLLNSPGSIYDPVQGEGKEFFIV